MAVFQSSTTVQVDSQKAYDYLADVTKHTEWSSHDLEVQKTSDGPAAVGSTFATVGKQFGTHSGEVKITELVPGKKIVYESEGDTGHFRHEFSLDQGENGTVISKAFEPLQTRGPLKLFSPLLPFIAPRGLAGDLAKIKARLEG